MEKKVNKKRKQNKRKKMNNKGFTLIELLAVITIMGILMMVAIPAVTRTIENSRRDSFNTIAKSYMDAVRDAWVADNIVCYDNGRKEWTVASGVPGSTTGADYYFPICTDDKAGTDANAGCLAYTASNGGKLEASEIKQSTLDLMESGGTSSFGNAPMYGWVKVTKTDTESTDPNEPAKTTIKYVIMVGDSGKHGYASERTDKELTRTNVNTALGSFPTNATAGNGTDVSSFANGNFCKLS